MMVYPYNANKNIATNVFMKIETLLILFSEKLHEALIFEECCLWYIDILMNLGVWFLKPKKYGTNYVKGKNLSGTFL